MDAGSALESLHRERVEVVARVDEGAQAQNGLFCDVCALLSEPGADSDEVGFDFYDVECAKVAQIVSNGAGAARGKWFKLKFGSSSLNRICLYREGE